MNKEDINTILEKAIAIAAKAHAGQRDKAGSPYILHPLRVMMKLDATEEKIVAVLHDVLEDGTPEYAEEVRALLPDTLFDALLCVTKQDDEHGPEGYTRFIDRASGNPLARRVKIADLEDNLTITRLSTVDTGDVERLQRYLRSLQMLKAQETRAAEMLKPMQA